MRYRDGTLYVGGSFPGKTRRHSTRGRAPTPARWPWGSPAPSPARRGSTSVYDFAINPARTKIAATGNFLTPGTVPRPVLHGEPQPRHRPGQPRQLVLPRPGQGVFDARSHAGWPTCTASTSPRTGAISSSSPPGRSPLGGLTSGTPPAPTPRTPPCATAPVGSTCPTTPSRDGSTTPGGDSVWAAAVTGPAVYVQGHFQWFDNWDGSREPVPGRRHLRPPSRHRGA